MMTGDTCQGSYELPRHESTAGRHRSLPPRRICATSHIQPAAQRTPDTPLHYDHPSDPKTMSWAAAGGLALQSSPSPATVECRRGQDHSGSSAENTGDHTLPRNAANVQALLAMCDVAHPARLPSRVRSGALEIGTAASTGTHSMCDVAHLEITAHEDESSLTRTKCFERVLIPRTDFS